MACGDWVDNRGNGIGFHVSGILVNLHPPREKSRQRLELR